MKTPSIVCPLCGVGHWVAHDNGEFNFSHGHNNYVVKNQEYALCNHCNTKGFLPGQRDSNRAKIQAFQATLSDYISPSTILALREKYCLTQIDATKIFGGGKQGFSKWERGTATPSGATARLLKMAFNVPPAMKYLCEQAGVPLTHEKINVKKSGENVIAIYEVINTDTSENIRDDKFEVIEDSYIQDDRKYK